MAKTKRELRAEAVERLRRHKPIDSFTASLLGDVPKGWMAKRDALIDLLTDDDGHQVEGDAVAILRKAANDENGLSVGRLILDTDADDTSDALAKLADMVERGYVSREKWSEAIRAMKAAQDAMEQARDERDELSDKIGEITEASSELMKKQPYTFGVHDVPGSLRTVGRYIDELTAERDELQKELDIANAKLIGKAEDIKYTRNRFSALEKAKNDRIAKLEAERDEALEIRDKALGDAATFKSERDEWKAKAESALHENPCVGLVRGKQWERTEISEYYCGGCGYPVTDHDSYCRECGGRLHEGIDKSRWFELFGTPERAARTMMRYLVNGCDGVECMDGCPFYDATTPTHCAITSTSEAALLEWLRGDAE